MPSVPASSGSSPMRADRGAEPRSFDEVNRDQHDGQRAPDQCQKAQRLDAALEHPADAAEALRAVGADGLAADLDLPVEQLEQDAQHLRRGERRHREIEAAQAQRRQPDERRDRGTADHGNEKRQKKRQAEHRRGNPRGVGADAEKGLLAERELARDQQQVGRGRDKRQQADAGQYADRVFIHGGLAARSTNSSR